MKIKLNNGKPAAEESIVALEAALGFPLSDSFRVFAKSQDGAKPEANIFKVSHDNRCGVNRFIPVSEISKERTRLDHLGQRAYPVAWAEGGNYVIIDEGRHGAVFFWDHEAPKTPAELAGGFAAFHDLLEPFDAGMVRLEPGQVKRVWVDPEFLKKREE